MLMTRIEDFALRMGIAPETLLAAGIGFAETEVGRGAPTVYPP